MADGLAPWDLTGRRVLVTGGGRGIGRAIATRFLDSGAEVAIVGRTEPDDLPSGSGGTALFLAADLRDHDQAATVVARAADELGGLDVLVNNAGGSPPAEAATLSPRFFDKIVALNLGAAFTVSQAANTVMRSTGGGVIVNVGSISATDPNPGTAAYTAAKAGLRALSRALALEWGPVVRVNHLSVGQVRTPDTVEWYGGGEAGRDAVARLEQVVPAGRMASPEDVASACLYLASPLAAYVSGADLEITGGGEFPARHVVEHRDG